MYSRSLLRTSPWFALVGCALWIGCEGSAETTRAQVLFEVDAQACTKLDCLESATLFVVRGASVARGCLASRKQLSAVRGDQSLSIDGVHVGDTLSFVLALFCDGRCAACKATVENVALQRRTQAKLALADNTGACLCPQAQPAGNGLCNACDGGDCSCPTGRACRAVDRNVCSSDGGVLDSGGDGPVGDGGGDGPSTRDSGAGRDAGVDSCGKVLTCMRTCRSSGWLQCLTECLENGCASARSLASKLDDCRRSKCTITCFNTFGGAICDTCLNLRCSSQLRACSSHRC